MPLNWWTFRCTRTIKIEFGAGLGIPPTRPPFKTTWGRVLTSGAWERCGWDSAAAAAILHLFCSQTLTTSSQLFIPGNQPDWVRKQRLLEFTKCETGIPESLDHNQWWFWKKRLFTVLVMLSWIFQLASNSWDLRQERWMIWGCCCFKIGLRQNSAAIHA